MGKTIVGVVCRNRPYFKLYSVVNPGASFGIINLQVLDRQICERLLFI